MINLETMDPSKRVVGNTSDDKSSGPSEKPIRNAELDGDDQSARKDVVMSNECQGEVHAGGDKDVDLAQTMNRAHIDFQEKDCLGDIGAKLDKLMDVKDSHVPQFNEKEITSESPFKGETSREVDPVKEIDEHSDVQPMAGISNVQPMDEISHSASRYSAPLTRPRSVSPEIERKDREKRPAIVCEFFAKGWCIKGSACRFLHQKDNAVDANHKLEEDIALQNSDGDGAGFNTSGKDAVGGVLKQNSLSDMPTVSRSSSEVHHSFSEHASRLRSFGLSSSSHAGNRLSYHTSMEEASLRPSQYMLNDHSASGLGYSVNHYHMSYWRSHLSSHSSLRQDGPHKTFTSNKGDDAFRSSLVSSSSADLGRSYHTSMPRESSFSYGYQIKFTPYNWEPSTPFRPSLSSSSPRSQHDLIHDSIEQPAEGNSVKPSPGAGLSLHGTSYSWNSDKRQSCSHPKDTPMIEAESAAASATDAQAQTSMPKDVECGTEHQIKIEQKVDKGSQDSEIDVDPSEYDSAHRESKALKHFRGALIEFVKTLLRPIWHEGALTKDAFKIIVQKAEDKVVKSLQPNQVPATVEQINQYLSSSKPKILKLLEGYALKYKKAASTQVLD